MHKLRKEPKKNDVRRCEIDLVRYKLAQPTWTQRSTTTVAPFLAWRGSQRYARPSRLPLNISVRVGESKGLMVNLSPHKQR